MPYQNLDGIALLLALRIAEPYVAGRLVDLEQRAVPPPEIVLAVRHDLEIIRAALEAAKR